MIKARKEVVASMLETLQCYEGDAVMSEDDPDCVIIPYYAHGRMNYHTIDMVSLAESALSALILAGETEL